MLFMNTWTGTQEGCQLINVLSTKVDLLFAILQWRVKSYLEMVLNADFPLQQLWKHVSNLLLLGRSFCHPWTRPKYLDTKPKHLSVKKFTPIIHSSEKKIRTNCTWLKCFFAFPFLFADAINLRLLGPPTAFRSTRLELWLLRVIGFWAGSNLTFSPSILWLPPSIRSFLLSSVKVVARSRSPFVANFRRNFPDETIWFTIKALRTIMVM